MTNLIDKQRLVAALDIVREGLKTMAPTGVVLAGLGYPESKAYNTGATEAICAVLDGIARGVYDAEDMTVLDEIVVARYSEEDSDDTEDMTDAPEGPTCQGIVTLPPSMSPDEELELAAWYAKNGYITKKNG